MDLPCAVEDQARLGFAIAHALDDSAPAVDGLSQDLQGKVGVIVQALAGAKKPLIISGTNAAAWRSSRPPLTWRKL